MDEHEFAILRERPHLIVDDEFEGIGMCTDFSHERQDVVMISDGFAALIDLLYGVRQSYALPLRE